LLPNDPSSRYDSPPRLKAITIVGSRPIWLDTQPKNGRANPFMMLSSTSAATPPLATTSFGPRRGPSMSTSQPPAGVSQVSSAMKMLNDH